MTDDTVTIDVRWDWTFATRAEVPAHLVAERLPDPGDADTDGEYIRREQARKQADQDLRDYLAEHGVIQDAVDDVIDDMMSDAEPTITVVG